MTMGRFHLSCIRLFIRYTSPYVLFSSVSRGTTVRRVEFDMSKKIEKIVGAFVYMYKNAKEIEQHSNDVRRPRVV